MRLKINERMPPESWDILVAQLGGTINHTSFYARYQTAAEHSAVPQFISLETDSNEIVGAALAFIVKSQNPLSAYLTGQLRLPTMPATKSSSVKFLETFFSELEVFALNKGCAELVINSSAAGWGGDILRNRQYITTDRFEFEIDLTQGEDVLWEGIERKRRKNINKARRLGVELIDMNNLEGISHLRRLQQASSMRILSRGGQSIGRKGPVEQDPIREYLRSDGSRLVCAAVDGNIVSAGLFTYFNDLVYHTLSGHSRESLDAQAPTFLIWEVMNQYRLDGAKRFNFGGCKVTAEKEGDPEHGVYEYKMGFNGKRIQCTNGKKILRPIRMGFASVFRRLMQN